MKTVISSCRITFRSLLRYNYLTEKALQGGGGGQNYFNSKAVISVPLFYLRCFCDFIFEDSKWKSPNATSTELTSVLKFLAV